MLALRAALTAWEGVDLAAVRAKSLALGDMAIACFEATVGAGTVVTPREHHRRGSHLGLAMPHASRATRALADRGIVGDFRVPDILRLGFAPLYLTYVQVWDALEIIADVVGSQASIGEL
jgi:kynureninase